MITDIFNYREAAPDLATSGQPKESQLAAVAAAGYKVVINLALHDDPRYSLPDERLSVESQGMTYIHIPVRFDNPTKQDLLAFFEAMAQHQGQRVWVHCAANMRVTAFLGLYRALRQGWAKEEAFALMRSIWQPNHVWSRFIAEQLVKQSIG
jgi:uncharacterized protein (TIGR01244 family)